MPTTSSARFKDDILDMTDPTHLLMALRPVSFRYKPEIDPDGRTQYGLIAEEVAQIAPELVARDDDGQINSVRYNLVNALVLGEVQRLYSENLSQNELIAAQQRARGLAVLLISHDLALVARHAEEVAVMYAGRVVERAPPAELFASPRHPYTRALWDALPQHGFKPIPGA